MFKRNDLGMVVSDTRMIPGCDDFPVSDQNSANHRVRAGPACTPERKPQSQPHVALINLISH
jgi:hypothetical protein